LTGIDYKIVDIGQATPDSGEPADLASLHQQLLGHSPLVLMGPEFMRQFYYSILPEHGLITGAVAYVDDEPAGFIVATGDPEGFMSAAVRRFWLRLCWIMFRSVLASPRRVLAIKEAYTIQGNVQTQSFGPEVGELLSFGVLPQFRSRSFVKRTSLHIGADLLRRAVEQLSAAGKTRIRAVVDKGNLEAKFFYRSQGWRVGLADVQGWSVPTMEFLLDCDSVISD
jgi:ribosomal protein S18 acetylase RimI-like enzyme